MKGQSRLDQIMDYLKSHNLVTVEQLVSAISASPATIRRDLIKLDKEGVISLGQCGSQNIEDILQSPRAQAIHEGFQNGILVEDLCQKCTFIARFDNKLKSLVLKV